MRGCVQDHLRIDKILFLGHLQYLLMRLWLVMPSHASCLSFHVRLWI
jgi:hypothetical protein